MDGNRPNPKVNMDQVRNEGRTRQGQSRPARTSNGHSLLPNETPRHFHNDRDAPNPRLSHGRVSRDERKRVTNISIATFNCRTLMKQPDGETKLEELERALGKVSVNILGLAETRREGEEMMERDDGSLICWNGPKGEKGTGFWIDRTWRSQVEEFKAKSERISILKIKINKKTSLKIVQVYAPTSSSSIAELETFYDDLQDVLDDGTSGKLIVMGDMNAKIGRREVGETNVGNYGFGQRNERGYRFIEFAEANNLKILNSFFKKRDCRKWTWESPNGHTKNEIDFIMARDRNIVLDIDVINKFEFDSDHRILRAKLKLDQKLERAKWIRNFVVPGEKILQRSEEFELNLKNRFSVLNEIEELSINDTYEKMKVSIQETTKQMQFQKMKKPKKITDQTEALIKRREELRLKRRESRNNEIEFCEVRKLVKKCIREDIVAFHLRMIEDVIRRNKSLKKAYKVIEGGKKLIKCVSKDGREITNRREISNAVTAFYKELYERRNDSGEDRINHQDRREEDNASDVIDEVADEDPDPEPIIIEREVELALRDMKHNRAPGEDAITTELLKAGGRTLRKRMCLLFNMILDQGYIPEDWRNAEIVLIHKKGSKKDIKNYRPISLLSHMYKVFTRIIQRRIQRIMDENQPREQAGFRKGYSTIDHIHSINQLIEKSNEYNKNVTLVLIDYEKAFDSISHQEMIGALRSQGIKGKILRVIKNIYAAATASVKMEDRGQKFSIERGVRQGDPISPKLFTALLEYTFRKCNWSDRAGISIDGEKLRDLRFADDIVLIDDDPEELQRSLNELNDQGKKVGLKINTAKTKAMTNGIQRALNIEGQSVEYVQEFVYLGQSISFENRQSKEISRRIQNAWRAFWKLKQYLLTKDITIKAKKRLFEMCIMPILTYGSQTWSLTKAQSENLRVAQRAMERRILGISLKDKVRNEEIRRRTLMKDVVQEARHLKWKWAGHVMRRDDNRWSTRLTVWTPRDGIRGRGRQKLRWRDEFPKGWATATKDRGGWIRMTREAIFLTG